MDIIKEILKRKSARHFHSTPLQKDKLERVLDAGRLAPSAKNRQQWRFIVVEKQELREEIKKAAFGEAHVGQAPVIIAACTTNIDYKMPNGQLSYPIDIAIAVSYMTLQAAHEGIGSCCITTFNEQKVKYLLTVPHTMRIPILLLLGHTDADREPHNRKSLGDIVSYDHW